MILKSIILKDFKCYAGEHIFEFDKITQVSGPNGVGKSCLIKDSLKFCLYGDSAGKLEALPTRGVATKCQVTVRFELDGSDYLVTRWYPSKLEIFKDDEVLVFGNNTQKQQYIDSLLGNLEVFKKFRLVDFRDGINVLEGTELAIKKTLFTLDEDLINGIRKDLLDVISERERGNRDVYRASCHYPSPKRLACLKRGLNEVDLDIRECQEIVERCNKQKMSDRGWIYSAENTKLLATKRIQSFSVEKKCSECGQIIQYDTAEIVDKANKNISDAEATIDKYTRRIAECDDIIAANAIYIPEYHTKRDRILKRISALEMVIKQSQLKYTTQDVLEAKEALAEFDKFGSYYLQSQLTDIEPIINDITSLISLQVRFDISDKSKLDIKIVRDEQEYSYSELSEGQKMIVGVAFKLALLMKDSKSGLVVTDEGFSCLSDENTKLVLELFKGTPFQLVFVRHSFTADGEVSVINL